MATYRGGEVPVPDRLDEDLKLVGQKLGGMENVEEELNLPPSAEPDYEPKPGQKGYGSSTHVTFKYKHGG